MSLPVCKRNDLLDSLSPLSIKLKRLQWKKVMKKKFWKKHRISRSCISLICRQLLNIELQLKRHKARQPLSAIEENKSSHAEPKIRKLDRVPEFEESTKSPHKKLKQGNENYLTLNEKSDKLPSIKEKNNFDGFEMDLSSISLKKKNQLLKSPEFSTKSYILQTQSGVKCIKVKSFPLSKSKSLHTALELKPKSNLNSFPKSHSDSEIQPPRLESQIKSEEVQFKTSVPNGHNGLEDTEPIKNLLKIETRVASQIPPERESLFKKDEGITKRETKYLNGVKQTMPAIVERDAADKDPSMRDKDTEMDPIEDSSPDVSVWGDSTSTATKDDNSDSQEGLMPEVNALRDFDSSDSSNKEEEDALGEDNFPQPSVNPASFLECNLDADKNNEDQFENSFTMSQNFQLNCDVRILVTPLLVKDITNTFCYHNNISGISGFRIRRHLQDMNFKAHVHYAIAQRSISHVRNDNIAQRSISHVRDDACSSTPMAEPPVDNSDDQDPPQPSVMDPFTHCVFEPIITRQRRLMRIEKKKAKNKIPFILSHIFKPGSVESQAKKSEWLSRNSRVNIFKVSLPHPNSSTEMNTLNKKGNSFVPGTLGTSSGTTSSRIALIPNSSHFLTNMSSNSKRVDALMPIKITDQTISRHNPHISVPSNSSSVSSPASTCSYVLVPQGFQVRGSHVLYKTSPLQSTIQTTTAQPHPKLYQTNMNGLSVPTPLITPPSGEILASPNPFSSNSPAVLGNTNTTLPHNHFPIILHSTLSGAGGPTLNTTSPQVLPNCAITMNGQPHSLVSRHSNQPLFATIPIGGTHPLVNIPSHGPTLPLVSMPSHSHTHPLVSMPSHGHTHPLVSMPSHGHTHPLVSMPSHGHTHPLVSMPSHGPTHSLVSMPSHGPTHPLVSMPSHGPTHPLVSMPSHGPMPLASIPSHGSTPIAVSMPRGTRPTLSSDVEVPPFPSSISQSHGTNYAELTTRAMPHLVPTLSTVCAPQPSAPISNQSPLTTTATSSTDVMTASPISIPHNQGPPPLKLGNTSLVKSGSIHSISQPPQLKKMLTQIPPPQLPQSDPSTRLIMPVGADNWDINIKPMELRKWLLIITQGSCKKNLEVKNWNDVISYLKAFISFGFSTKSSSLLNAAYQMLLGSMCCPHHTAEFIRKCDFTNHLQGMSVICDQQVGDFLVPAIPIVPNEPNLAPQEPHYDLFVLKRFVFAVERESRVVLYPLPPSCIPKDNANFDKITVVILMSPRVGLGPGLIVFPHSFLDRHLRLSLGDTGSLGCDWAIGAHQRGGLTQSMMIDFLNGQGLHWILDTHRAYKSPQLAVDWWFCIEMDELNSFYSNFSQVSLPLFYPSHRDPFDACLGTALTNMWGVLVHNWKSTFQTSLTEDKFPKFIYKTLDILCDPKRLQTWCGASGLQPVNYLKSKAFQENDSYFSC